MFSIDPPSSSAVHSHGDAEQLEDLSLEIRERVLEDLQLLVMFLKDDPLYQAEQLEDSGSGGPLAEPRLGIERQALDPISLHGPPECTFDQGFDQEDQEVEEEEGLDPPLVLQEDRCDLEDALQVLEPFLDLRLSLVGFKYLSWAEALVVGQERVHAVRFLVPFDSLLIDFVPDREALAHLSQVPGVGPWSAGGLLPVPRILVLEDPDLHVVLHVVLGEDGMNLLLGRELGLDPRPRSGQLGAKLRKLLYGGLDVLPTTTALMECEEAAVDPSDRPVLMRWDLLTVDLPDIPGAVLPPWIGPIPHGHPGHLELLDPPAELHVLLARSWQHGDESAAEVVDRLHVIEGAELRVGHVEEIRTAVQVPESLPGLHVGGRVVGVSVLAPKLHGDSAVDAGGQDEEELFEIGPAGFRVAVGDPGRPAAADGTSFGLGILADEADGGGIVVEFLQGDPEFAEGVDHAGREEASSIGAEQSIQRPADLIVAEVFQRSPGDPERAGGKSLDDFLLAVDRFSLDEDGSQKDPQSQGMGKPGPGIVGRNILLEELVEAESIEEVVDEGKGAETFHSNGEVSIFSHAGERGCQQEGFSSTQKCIIVISDDGHPTYDDNISIG